jgi:Glycerophosphoryl diester phosphodiesterase family
VRTVRIVGAIAALVVIVFVPKSLAAARQTFPRTHFASGEPSILPTAAGTGTFGENTLYAYEQSVLVGSEVIDVDVRLSKDGQPIAIPRSRSCCDAFQNVTTYAYGAVSMSSLGPSGA